ncbi:MAG: bifunctional folylpolyglutamate synthase/dihydrofolate synthase [Gemmatimonadota bacterium]|nr:bifunctional folylpolyglutamate synthase/dihydrofolate synthase [Gemmatimonadota bacterium]MDH3422102.1 bifunctional folylpolyglutamate synthase/dihydrofolate synthase [Gemmatimonadota bacterium]
MERLESDPRTPDRLDRPFEDPLLYELFPALATNVEWGLQRTERALELIGDPHRNFASLHVGGTNGKGSVTATLASITRAAGHRSGCYVSPHLVSFRERILVDGDALTEDALKEYASEVRGAVTTCGLTFFEAATVLAFHAFARESVDVAALEVGLGGRLDATNVVRPMVSAVTNVAMDHADYLGDTLLDIAREKAGIMKRGVPFVTSESDPDVLALFAGLSGQVGAPLWHVATDRVQDLAIAADQTSFRLQTRSWGEVDIVTPLIGAHQATNTALAVEVCEHLPADLRPKTSALLSGVASVAHRGRDEVVTLGGRTWLFDVAHNPAGVSSLCDTLERIELPRPVIGLVGVLGDKDWAAMLPLLLSRCDDAILTQPPSAPMDRRWDPSEAARAVVSGRVPKVLEDFEAALAEAAALAGNGTVVVTGSVHTVGGAMARLGIAPLA